MKLLYFGLVLLVLCLGCAASNSKNQEPLKVVTTNFRSAVVKRNTRLDVYLKHVQWIARNEYITGSSFPDEVVRANDTCITYCYVDFNRPATVTELVSRMAESHLRPATLRELIGIAANRYRIQPSEPLLALGSVSNRGGELLVPSMRFTSEDDKRYARLELVCIGEGSKEIPLSEFDFVLGIQTN